MRPTEVQLVDAEAHALFVGTLMAYGHRWVDHPHSLATAANKVFQLMTARRIGFLTPNWLVTNEPCRAKPFIAERPTLAKAVSSGDGLNPDPGVVSVADIPHVRLAPVMLQHVVPATHDVRIVTVGQEVLAWQRPRASDGPIAWRSVDPQGVGFVRVSANEWRARAVTIASSVGVSTSVQDWLVSQDGEPVFLELNTRGAWLFLPEAEDLLPPLFAAHLASDV